MEFRSRDCDQQGQNKTSETYVVKYFWYVESLLFLSVLVKIHIWGWLA